MKRLLSREDAFTGLEAAIVLIAFVVVAAVFSYVVLGAGFFTTQKSQQTVITGVQQATSSFELLGDVIGLGRTTAGSCPCPEINFVNFTMGLAPGGEPIDMTKVAMVWSNQTNRTELNKASPLFNTNPSAGQWAIVRIANGNTNNYLETGEQMDISVHLIESGSAIVPRDTFTLEVKPIVGPALSIKREGPGGIDPVNALR
jgi:archaeal flagellin FlaB